MELTRFVYAGMFITAEVTFRNGGSHSATFCCQARLNAEGGRINCGMDKTLAPGETHVAWAKLKADAFSDDKYSLNIESILNAPSKGSR